ncbi:MAG: ATPase, T2SS/T4P/T4SS family [Thermodesulfobacteriota bacterium]|nr:ATPase, T2SS/T4P/T4SS family [Thermodesulfobacteriota bacterium]
MDKEGTSEIVDRANSFKELGLFKEAVNEYEKLVGSDNSPSAIVPELVSCLVMVYSASEAIKQLKHIINRHGLGEREIIQMQFVLGLELEKRNHRNLARDLYKSALDIDPKNQQIKDRLDSLMAGPSPYFGSRYDYMVSKNIITVEQLENALKLSRKMKKSVEFVLINHFNVKKGEVGKHLSAFYGCPFRDFDHKVTIPIELVANMKKSFLLHDLWVPMSWGKEGVEILIDDPNDLRKTGQISALIQTKKVYFSVGIKEDIEQFITLFFDKKLEEPIEDLLEGFDMVPDISFDEEEILEEEKDLLDESSGQVVRLVDQTIVTAYRMDASDIHVEPSPITRKTGIRFRLDGVCQEYLQVPISMAKGILSRLKIMAGIDIAERRLPQDGKIKFKRKGISGFELRLATIPTTEGYEDAVLRILAKAGAMKLDEMALSERNISILKKIISLPYGLILAVGPTGSGKTTTLHAGLGYINKPGVKIWTVEDPVEITQLGLRQVEVKPKIGLNFARVMRSFLRADPDVIMIGEMRDHETAATGIEASLTGHLVFSTLHTNSAPETITRLLDMGLNPLNFSDAFLGVLAQRLVRKLCLKCRKEYHPSKEEFEEIAMEYGLEEFKTSGLKYSRQFTLYKPMGCEQCSGTGYKGRMGIHELMEGTPEIKRLIKKQGSTEDLFAQGIKEGMTTLKQDGIHKVFQGLTDINELRRVCID